MYRFQVPGNALAEVMHAARIAPPSKADFNLPITTPSSCRMPQNLRFNDTTEVGGRQVANF